MKFKILCSIFCSCGLLFLSGGEAAAARFDIENDRVYAHKSAGGEIVFFTANQNPPSLFHSAQSSLYLAKVFSAEAPPYYYFYLYADDSRIKKNPGVQAKIFIDEKEVKTSPLPQLFNGVQGSVFRGWYKVEAAEIDAVMRGLQSMHFSFMDGEKVIKDVKVNNKRFASFSRLADIRKEEYIREGIVFAEAKDSIKDIIMPQVYLPGMTVENVQGAILAKIAERIKEKRLEMWRICYGGDPWIFAVEGRENIDNANSYITFAAIPDQEGVLLKMHKNRKYYSSSRTKYGTNYYTGLVKLVDSSGIVNMCDYWRSVSEDWDALFFEVCGDLYGRSFYGFDFRVEKSPNGQGNLFFLYNINKEQFPVLSEVEENDRLKSIDGTDTSFMRYMDLAYKLAAEGKAVELVIADKSGKEKRIEVKPVFKAAEKPAKEYSAPFEKIKMNRENAGMVYDEDKELLFCPIELEVKKPSTEDKEKKGGETDIE